MDKIEELLTRGVDKIYPSKEALEQVLRTGKKLKLYQGFDPTGTKLHLGHMVGLRKLAQWQALGHHVIFLIGDGTGQAGDPSGKTVAISKFHTNEELRQNAKDYVMQAEKIVKFSGDNPVEILYNGDWLNKLKLVDVLNIAENFSLQQLSERDFFQERIKKGETVNLREFLYPLLQAYDSVVMEVDLELGGSDQTFNMLAGRTLMKSMKGKEKFVMTTPLIADSSGRKIGKSEGNSIGIDDEPNDLFGKIMAFPDEVVFRCFECLTTLAMKEVKALEGGDPMLNKKRLAFEILVDLHGKDVARRAEENWGNTFQKKEIPENVEEVEIQDRPIDTLTVAEVAESASVARRLFDSGAVTDMTDEKKLTAKDNFKVGHVYRIGKHKFIKIKK